MSEIQAEKDTEEHRKSIEQLQSKIKLYKDTLGLDIIIKENNTILFEFIYVKRTNPIQKYFIEIRSENNEYKSISSIHYFSIKYIS